MGRMYPLDPKPDDMRAMGEAAVEFLIGFIHGLDDAPLSNAQGSIDLARSLRASPPRLLDSSFLAGCEEPVSHIIPKLFTVLDGEEVVENKSFKLRSRGALLPSFLDRTVEAQRTERLR